MEKERHIITNTIIDTDNYINKANRLLSDKASYQQLTQDPIPHNEING